VSHLQRVRRQQILRQAEGYLELLTATCDQWETTPAVRDKLANRVLELLKDLRRPGSFRGDKLFLQGQALRLMERYGEAVRPLRRAAEEDPGNVHIWLALGWCYKRLGRLDMAIESLEEALAADPDRAIVYYNLACYWSLAENAQLAVEYLARAFEIDSNYRDLVDKERDFDPIRNDPEFLAVTSVIV